MATTYINPFVFAAEELGGMVLLTPTSITYSGTSATVGANGSVEFSACTSLSLNGVFSADYDNYMVSMRFTHSTTSVWPVQARLRVSGTDNSTASSYTNQYLLVDSTSVSADRNALTYMDWSYAGGTRSGLTAHIYGPFLAQPTAMRTVTANDSTSGPNITERVATHNQSTSYDGFTLIYSNGANTFTGLVSVYGLVGA